MPSMDDFHCDTFEMSVRFKPHEMDVDAFLKALAEKGIDAKPDADGDIRVALTFPGDKETYHAHLEINLWKSGRGRAELGYHSGREKGVKISLSSANSCARWLSAFFKDSLRAHAHVNYTFDKSFATSVSLPFPLVTDESALAGSMVSGLALKLPNQTDPTILQRIDDKIFIFLRNTFQVDLAQFDLTGELEKLSPTVGKLVKKVDQEAK
jgi:hypothetical protein